MKFAVGFDGRLPLKIGFFALWPSGMFCEAMFSEKRLQDS